MGILEVIGVAFLQFLMGYGIAVTSREVHKGWHENEEVSFARGLFAKLLLYPASAFDLVVYISRNKPEGAFKNLNGSPWYVVLHLFFWEVRIAVNLLFLLIVVLISAIAVPITSLIKGVDNIFQTFAVKEEKPVLVKTENPTTDIDDNIPF